MSDDRHVVHVPAEDEAVTLGHGDKCPVCLGTSLCHQMSAHHITLSMFGEHRSYGTVYDGAVTGSTDNLSVISPVSEHWDKFDAHLCKLRKKGDTCDVSRLAHLTWLHTWPGDPGTVRTVHSTAGHITQSPLTACVTHNMVTSLRRAFDEDNNGLSLKVGNHYTFYPI